MKTPSNDMTSCEKPKMIQVEVLAAEGVQLPHYASLGAAGLDIRAHLDSPMTLHPGQTALVPTGLKVAIPQGWEIQIRPRSGMALKHQVIPLNTPGTIDSDYRGEIKIILANLGAQPFVIDPGMRVAQMVLARYDQLEWMQVDALSETARGENGFGGTGVL
jgi:dUTP pyrophosphatase